MYYKLFQVKRNLIGKHTHNYPDLKSMKIEVDLKNYDMIYEGKSDLSNHNDVLEDLFDLFNINHPKDFAGRSMSVSDIVQLEDKYFFCDSIGWKEVLV